jgi:hypothetical protein
MQEPGEDPKTPEDTDGDPGTLNPRDLRDVASGDGAREDEGGENQDADADPESLNPRDER